MKAAGRSRRLFTLSTIHYPLLRQFERIALPSLRHGAATDALGANSHRFSCAVGRSHMDTLQVGAKLATGDAGDFCTHPAKVFGFTSMGNLIAQSGLLSTNFTCLSHSRHSPLGQSCRHGDKRLNIPAGPGDARGTSWRARGREGGVV